MDRLDLVKDLCYLLVIAKPAINAALFAIKITGIFDISCHICRHLDREIGDWTSPSFSVPASGQDLLSQYRRFRRVSHSLTAITRHTQLDDHQCLSAFRWKCHQPPEICGNVIDVSDIGQERQ